MKLNAALVPTRLQSRLQIDKWNAVTRLCVCVCVGCHMSCEAYNRHMMKSLSSNWSLVSGIIDFRNAYKLLHTPNTMRAISAKVFSSAGRVAHVL